MELKLSGGGVTSCVIVKPDNATPVDSYAVRILAEGLKQKTGVTFPVVGSAGAGEQKRICVGVSAAAEKDLGRDPRLSMRDQEFAVRSIWQNIYLCGKGVHGNLYAVVDFLDNTLERRWCVNLVESRFGTRLNIPTTRGYRPESFPISSAFRARSYTRTLSIAPLKKWQRSVVNTPLTHLAH